MQLMIFSLSVRMSMLSPDSPCAKLSGNSSFFVLFDIFMTADVFGFSLFEKFPLVFSHSHDSSQFSLQPFFLSIYPK